MIPPRVACRAARRLERARRRERTPSLPLARAGRVR